jgi:hypothetical protein
LWTGTILCAVSLFTAVTYFYVVEGLVPHHTMKIDKDGELTTDANQQEQEQEREREREREQAKKQAESSTPKSTGKLTRRKQREEKEARSGADLSIDDEVAGKSSLQSFLLIAFCRQLASMLLEQHG